MVSRACYLLYVYAEGECAGVGKDRGFMGAKGFV